MTTDDGGHPQRMRIGWTGIVTLAATLIVAGLLAPPPVRAHVTLVASDPEADAVLTAAPDEVSLTFTGELMPEGSSFQVTDADGQTVGTGTLDLEVAERNILRGAVAIGAPGRFEVQWVITALDGHSITGEVAFTVGTAPNTAVPTPARVTMLGVATLLVATALMTRQVLARDRS